MFEQPELDQFANEFSHYITEKELGFDEKLSVKVLLCDERDWANLAPWATATSGVSASKWKNTDGFMLSLALKPDLSGIVGRTTEPERLEKLVHEGFRLEIAKLVSPYDCVVLLRDAWLKNEDSRLSATAYQVIQGINMIRDPSDPQYTGKRARSLNVDDLIDRFKVWKGHETSERSESV
jgi:hypothetical protein